MVLKTEKIMEHILDRDSEIVFLSETWLTSDSNHVTALVNSCCIIDGKKDSKRLVGELES